MRERLLASSILGGAALLAAAVASPAAAQQAKAAADTEVEGIVVTGSRIVRQDYVAESPIVTVAQEAIEATGDVTLERLFTQLPQVLVSNGAQVNNGGNGQVNISLRGIGQTRTLVLVDGKRPQATTSNGTVDLNTIPAALIENIEVITGGASAAYGSDAISGVVNFKLKKNFQGVVIDAQYNVTDKNDGKQQGITATAGSNFADDRGNAVVSFSFDNRGSVFYGDRPGITVDDPTSFGLTDPRILAVGGLSATGPMGNAGTLANFGINATGTNVTGANAPTQAAVNTIFGRYGVPASQIPTVSNATVFGFNPNGTLFFKGVNYKGPTTIDYSTIPTTVAGNGPGSYNTGALNYAMTPQIRYNAFAKVDYEFNPSIIAYGQFTFTDFTAHTVLAPTPASGNPGTATNAAATINTGFLVPVTNPFLPADLKELLASRPNPTAPFLFNKRFNEFGGRDNRIQYTTYQFMTGIRGELDWLGENKDLTYDLYATHGKLTRIDYQSGNLNRTTFRQLLESPNGQLGPCTNYNPFGENGITADCKAFLSPITKNLQTLEQEAVELTFQGQLLTIPEWTSFTGGDVRFALGADYRSERFASTPDSLASGTDRSGTVGSATNPFNNALAIAGFGAGQGLSGARDVYEIYGELLIPLLKDLPFIQELSVDIGGRSSWYNFSGAGKETTLDAQTYKIDGDWRVTDWLRVRGGYSRAIRAPGVGELYQPQQSNFATIGPAGALGSGDPCDITGAYRKGQGVSATGIRALCLAQGVPTGVIDVFQGNSLQAPSTSGGNPLLQEETADTYTVGLVLQPRFDNPLFSRMSASIDYYRIKIDGYILALALGTSLSKCYNADNSNPTYSASNVFCQNIIRDPSSGQISNGFATALNTGGLINSGIDLQFDWSFNLSDVPGVGLSEDWGALRLNLIVNWVDDFLFRTSITDPYQQNRDSITSQGYTPVWKALLTLNYSVGDFDFTATERYLGEARDASCVGITSDCSARGVVPTFYTAVQAKWKFNDNFELRGGVDNLFDQAPRFFLSGTSSQAFSDATTYDFLGRRFYVGLKARF
jgi:iron complex outermembrane recepter protein